MNAGLILLTGSTAKPKRQTASSGRVVDRFKCSLGRPPLPVQQVCLCLRQKLDSWTRSSTARTFAHARKSSTDYGRCHKAPGKG